MRLLITTQKIDINDDVLGFMHGWVKEFAKQCEEVTVICLYKGEYELPENVKILSLGKEEFDRFSGHTFRFLRHFVYLLRFYIYIFRERKNYDNVFVHMNPEYVVLGGLFWKIWRKRIGLWYTHKQVNLKLKIAEKLSKIIFTASKESFRLESKKVNVMGHGIDFSKFVLKKKKTIERDIVNILMVGRISRIKNFKLSLEAAALLKNDGINFKMNIVGGADTRDQEHYLKELKGFIAINHLENLIKFRGSVPNKEISQFYYDSDLSINLCPTGGMDKVVLESLACGTPAIVLNKTFQKVFGEYKKYFILNDENEKELANKIKIFSRLDSYKKLEISLRLNKNVLDGHGLKNLIKNIIKNYE